MSKYEVAAYMNRDTKAYRADKKTEQDVVAQMRKRHQLAGVK